MLQLVVVHKVAVILGSRHCCLVLAFLLLFFESLFTFLIIRFPLLKQYIVVVDSCLWAAVKKLLLFVFRVKKFHSVSV